MVFLSFPCFFGSGNLVYPLKIGVDAQGQWCAGFLGLFLTGVVVPFSGVLVIKLFHGNWRHFFAQGGILVEHALPLVALSLLGSFGVLPRCIIVAHGSLHTLFPQLSEVVFACAFIAVAHIISLKEHWMIHALGKFLTPALLIFLIILITCGLSQSQTNAAGAMSTYASFQQGFCQGYETMDLLAAFFFSAVIFKNLQRHTGHLQDQSVFKIAVKSSGIGALLLSAVYLAFVYLGSSFQTVARGVEPEYILPTVAHHILGSSSDWVLAVIMILSCLTTFVALNTIYARYLTATLRASESFFPWILLGTAVVSVIVSSLNFQGISAFLAPILTVVYPGLIVLTVLSLCTRGLIGIKRIAFYSTTGFMILWYCIQG